MLGGRIRGRRKVRREEGEGRRDARQLPPFTPFLSPVLNLNTVIEAVHELWGLAGHGKGLQSTVQEMDRERRRAPGAVVATQKLTFHCHYIVQDVE